MFRRMTAKDDAIDPLEQGKKILGGLGIATLIVFVGPLILFEEEVPGTPGAPAPAASATACPVNTVTKDEGEFRFCTVPANDGAACGNLGGTWHTITAGDICYTSVLQAPVGSTGVAGGKTANFMTKIEGEVEAGARSLLEIFKWVLLAATVGAIVFLRMARVPANRLQSSR